LAESLDIEKLQLADKILDGYIVQQGKHKLMMNCVTFAANLDFEQLLKPLK
jgi:hypothetical protein